MKENLKKRPLKAELTFLAHYELYNLLMFVGLYFITKFMIDMAFGAKPFILQIASFYPLALVCLLLLEGSFYWQNSLNRVSKKKSLDRIKIGRIFYPIMWLNWCLIIAYLPIIAWSKSTIPSTSIIIGLLFYLLAIIEQINYFYVRLSYETVSGSLLILKPFKALLAGKGRKSQLRRDILLYLKSAKTNTRKED